jgi:hypothetical protein
MSRSDDRLEQLVEAWRAKGSPDQEGFPWGRSKSSWESLAHDFDLDIADFPELIDRLFLWSLNASNVSVHKIFLAVMIWGYGDIGYGPHRVRQMFESQYFVRGLEEARAHCLSGQFLDAYRCLKNSKIRQLGPAFGTKALSFFHERNGAPAILDSVVARWCNKHALQSLGELGIKAEVWSPRTYERFLGWMGDMSSVYGLPASTLEQLIFEDEYSDRSGL